MMSHIICIYTVCPAVFEFSINKTDENFWTYFVVSFCAYGLKLRSVTIIMFSLLFFYVSFMRVSFSIIQFVT